MHGDRIRHRAAGKEPGRLVLSKSRHRIDTRRGTRRQATCQQCDDGKQRKDAGVGLSIRWRDTE